MARWAWTSSRGGAKLVRMPSSSTCCVVPFLLLMAAVSSSIAAQCAPQIVPLAQRATVGGTVLCRTLWDPDGPGPLASRFVVGGAFPSAGGQLVGSIAQYDFATGLWSGFAGGFTSDQGECVVTSLLALPDGSLYAGGTFTHAAAVPTRGIARWDGVAWQPLGSGVAGTSAPSVDALARLPSGDLVAGGVFTTAGGVAARHLARFDGVAWHAFGDLDTGSASRIHALLVRGNGVLVATGDFTAVGGVAATRIAQWDGVAWSALAGGLPSAGKALLEHVSSGALLVGIALANAGPVLAWDGTAWSSFGASFGHGGVEGLAQLPNGTVLTAFASDFLSASPGGATAWSRFPGTTTAPYQCLEVEVLANGDVLACGPGFFLGTTSKFESVARWNGTAWSDLGAGTGAKGGNILCGAATPTGFVVGGQFVAIGGSPIAKIAQWNGTAWQALGSGIPNCDRVVSVVRRNNGDLLAGVYLTTFSSAIYRWNGSTWSVLALPGALIETLERLPNDDVVVATVAGASRWNGTTWTALGALSGTKRALGAMPNGDLVACGTLSVGGNQYRLARWNGVAWSGFGVFDGEVTAVEPLANGDLVVAGRFGQVYNGVTPVGSFTVARFDGTTWYGQGNGCWLPGYSPPYGVTTLAALPTGGYLAGGWFARAGDLQLTNLVRREGEAWWPIGQGVGPDHGVITAMFPLANGDVVVAGPFEVLDGQAAGGLARITPGCAPTVAAIPTRCIGPVGPMVATANSLPQLGTLMVTQANGYGPASIAATVIGGAPAYFLNLAAAFPTTGAGCELVPPPTFVEASLPIAGTATYALAIPNVAALVGLVLRQQYVQLELDANGAFASISVSNALQFAVQP